MDKTSKMLEFIADSWLDGGTSEEIFESEGFNRGDLLSFKENAERKEKFNKLQVVDNYFRLDIDARQGSNLRINHFDIRFYMFRENEWKLEYANAWMYDYIVTSFMMYNDEEK
tara:strand:- start:272 stop:610 length:339 start_codon:yes stop_codon:yes gene_type:complete